MRCMICLTDGHYRNIDELPGAGLKFYYLDSYQNGTLRDSFQEELINLFIDIRQTHKKKLSGVLLVPQYEMDDKTKNSLKLLYKDIFGNDAIVFYSAEQLADALDQLEELN